MTKISQTKEAMYLQPGDRIRLRNGRKLTVTNVERRGTPQYIISAVIHTDAGMLTYHKSDAVEVIG